MGNGAPRETKSIMPWNHWRAQGTAELDLFEAGIWESVPEEFPPSG